MSQLDTEEQALLDSVELGKWQPVPDLARQLQRYQHYAQVQTNGLESVNIELSKSDLQILQTVAQQSGRQCRY